MVRTLTKEPIVDRKGGGFKPVVNVLSYFGSIWHVYPIWQICYTVEQMFITYCKLLKFKNNLAICCSLLFKANFSAELEPNTYFSIRGGELALNWFFTLFDALHSSIWKNPNKPFYCYFQIQVSHYHYCYNGGFAKTCLNWPFSTSFPFILTISIQLTVIKGSN